MDSNFWDNVYQKKSETEVSWFQQEPTKSLELINEFKLKPEAKIIDIGGGDSRLTDHLLDLGFWQRSHRSRQSHRRRSSQAPGEGRWGLC